MKANSLDSFFSEDPLHLTDQNIDTIVAELRRARVHWQQLEAQGKKSAPRAPKQTLKLEDIL